MTTILRQYRALIREMKDGDVWLVEFGSGEDVDHLIEGNDTGDNLANGCVEFGFAFGAFDGVFGEGGFDGLEEANAGNGIVREEFAIKYQK